MSSFGNHHRSKFDPLLEIRSQGCAPGGQPVVVVRPVGNLAVAYPNDGGPLQRDWNLSRESAVERLRQGSLKCPFGDHVITTYENGLSHQDRVWVKFPCLLEEFSQELLVLKLQPNPVVFEPELLGKTSGGIVDLAVL